MMSWMYGFVQGRLEGHDGSAYMYKFEDADMIIQLPDPEETTAARLH